MNNKIRLLLILIALVISPTGNVLAGYPFITNDPDTLDYQQKEFYLSAILNSTKQNNALLAPALEIDYGFLPNVEIDLAIALASNLTRDAGLGRATGIGDLQLTVEYRFLQETDRLPEIAFEPVFIIPTGSEKRNLGNGKLWFQLPITLQKSWGAMTIYGGGGYAINQATEMKNYFFGGGVVEYQLNETWMLGGEIASQGPISTTFDSYTLINLGGAYNFTKNIQALFSAGHSILGEENIVAYLGLTWIW